MSLKQSYQCLNMNEVEFLTACHERGVARQTYADEQELELEFNQVLQHYQQKTVRL